MDCLRKCLSQSDGPSVWQSIIQQRLLDLPSAHLRWPLCPLPKETAGHYANTQPCRRSINWSMT